MTSTSSMHRHDCTFNPPNLVEFGDEHEPELTVGLTELTAARMFVCLVISQAFAFNARSTFSVGDANYSPNACIMYAPFSGDKLQQGDKNQAFDTYMALVATACRDEYNASYKPWPDFVSCAEEAAECSQHPTTLQVHCAKTCGTCPPEAPTAAKRVVACALVPSPASSTQGPASLAGAGDSGTSTGSSGSANANAGGSAGTAAGGMALNADVGAAGTVGAGIDANAAQLAADKAAFDSLKCADLAGRGNSSNSANTGGNTTDHAVKCTTLALAIAEAEGPETTTTGLPGSTHATTTAAAEGPSTAPNSAGCVASTPAAFAHALAVAVVSQLVVMW